MRVVVAPDKFKGCLSAAEVAGAIAEGLRAAEPGVELDLCPMADGGEGTVDTLVAATGGRLERRRVMGPLPEMKVEATFGVLGDGQTAVIEMAAASGLHLLKEEQRNPMRTTTYGTGELVMAAVEMGVKRIILGIGGSATVDAGLGCAQACGALILLDDGSRRGMGDEAVCGRDVARVTGVEHAWGQNAAITVACDVTNPLYGPTGASAVFGPQKGATADDVRELDGAMEQLAKRLGKGELARRAGAGAAGGLGFGMLAFFGAELRAGVEMVIEAVKLRERLRGADLCITGEGKLDAQSLAGKTPIGVARVCRQMGVPCVALAGAVGEDLDRHAAANAGITALFSIAGGPCTLKESMEQARGSLARVAWQVARLLRAAGPRFGCWPAQRPGG